MDSMFLQQGAINVYGFALESWTIQAASATNRPFCMDINWKP